MSKSHYYLVAGTVVFTVAEAEVMVHAPFNCTIQKTEKLPITVKDLGQAQVGLQQSLLRQVGAEAYNTMTVQNVVIQGMVHLGRMSEAEFKAAPEGQQLVEIANTPTPFG